MAEHTAPGSLSGDVDGPYAITNLSTDTHAKLLAASSAATAAATDMIEAVRHGERDEVSNAWTGETLHLLVDATRLLIEANDLPAADSQLYAALVKWIEDEGEGLSDVG